nr:hypothetical protein [bacterium]
MKIDVLEKPATVGDILAWNMAIPAVLAVWVPFYIATVVVPKFQSMFDSLGGKLPAVTVFVISWGGIYALGLAALVLVMVFLGLFKV